MILIELEGGGPRHYRLEFHPRVTVVVGLGAAQRRQLAATINDALGGHLRDVVLRVDVGGEPQLLTADLLATLGLAKQGVDNVIEPSDLPGAVVLGTTVPPAPPSHSAFGAGLSPDLRLLDQARRELQRAEVRAGEFARRLESARRSSQAEDVHKLKSYLDRVKGRILDATAALQAVEAEHGDGGSSARRQAIAARIAELAEHLRSLREQAQGPLPDSSEVVAALAALDGDDPHEGVQLADVEELRRSLSEVRERVESLEARQQPPQWLLFQIKDELDDARGRVAALEHQHAEGTPVAGEALDRARRRLSDAEASWEELENGVMGQLARAQDDLDVLLAHATALLGAEPALEQVDEQLKALAARLRREGAGSDHLASLLRQLGWEVGTSTAADSARQWLVHVHELDEQRSQARREAHEVEEELQELQRAATQLDQTAVGGGAAVVEAERQLAELREIEHELEVRLARAKSSAPSATTELADLERAHRNALADVAEIAQEVADLERRLHDPSSDQWTEGRGAQRASGGRPWWEGQDLPASSRALPLDAEVDVDMSHVMDDDVDKFVLSKAAALRRAGRGESIPLVIDGAFDGLSPDLAHRVLDVFPKIGHIVQIVYLASGDVAERWAKRQDESVVGIVRLQRG